jgi:hypothetical protein
MFCSGKFAQFGTALWRRQSGGFHITPRGVLEVLSSTTIASLANHARPATAETAQRNSVRTSQ